MSANVQFAEVSGRPGDGRPGTSAPTNGGEAGGVVGDGPGGVIGDGLGGGMVGRDVLGAPPPPNGHARCRDGRDWTAMDPAGDGRPGTSAPTIDGAAGGVMGIATGGVVGDAPGGVMVGRDVLGAPPPSNGLCTVTKRAVRRHGTDFGI